MESFFGTLKTELVYHEDYKTRTEARLRGPLICAAGNGQMYFIDGGIPVKEIMSCEEAIVQCLEQKYFSIAHLYKEEKTMNPHIHDCYEIYYSISGGKQFLIDKKYYDVNPGDVFVINNYEIHCLSQIDTSIHERIVISVHPEFIRNLSTCSTDLTACFCKRDDNFNHRAHLSRVQQEEFLFLVHKITSLNGFGADVIETSNVMELMVLLNELYFMHKTENTEFGYCYNEIVSKILEYINQNIYERITLTQLAGQLFLSEAYICRLFKMGTGTTINKYITSRRISIAKAKLAEDCTVNKALELSGFNDYSNFLHAFTKIVGMTPMQYKKHKNQM